MANLNFIVVFLEGVISLFSPCVLPIIPVYIAILTGSTGEKTDNIYENRSKPITNTILFVLGISTTFFILGMSMSYLSSFIFKNKQVLNIVGGIIIILMGIFFLGIIKLPSFGGSVKSSVQKREMSPLTAFLLGFTFSWGWSPCVGPMLASAIVMASNASSRVSGNIMILVYTLGFILPFLIIAIFYNKLANHLDKLNEHSDKIKKIGGILLIITGILMATGGMDKFIGAVNTDSIPVSTEKEKEEVKEDKSEDTTKVTEEEDKNEEEEEKKIIPAKDFTLVDQNGETHILSDYKGKVVFLNFWATWCPPCKAEMPDIQALYEERGLNKEDVVVIGVASPNLGKEGSEEDIKNYLTENELSFPVVFDIDGSAVMNYQISAYPTTFIIDKDGNVEGYVPGAIPKDFMDKIIDDVLNK